MKPQKLILFLMPLMMAQVARSSATTHSVDFTCCDLTNSFNKYIKSATDEPKQKTTTCDINTACSSSRVKMLQDSIKSINDITFNLNDQTNTITLTFVATDVADLSVLSVLGRFLTKDANERVHMTYEFNEDSNTLQPEYENCKFEKELYVSLLCVTIIILISLLAIQLDTPSVPAKQQNSIKEEGCFVVPHDSQLQYRLI